MTDVPELWWSPGHRQCWWRDDDGEFLEAGLSQECRETLPDDAVPLVPAEPVDDKGRGESYWRAHADGQMAERAGVDEQTQDEWSEWTEVQLTGDPGNGFPGYDFTFRSDRDSWQHMVGLLRRAYSSWTSVRTRRREVQQITRTSDWTDQPPFAPELADAPLVTGESGAPASLVVDQPVHDSTLPAELDQQDGHRP